MTKFEVGDPIRCRCEGYCRVHGYIMEIRGEQYIVANPPVDRIEWSTAAILMEEAAPWEEANDETWASYCAAQLQGEI